MDDRDESLRGKYAEWETDSLVRAFTTEKDDYNESALKLMEEELKKRGIVFGQPAPERAPAIPAQLKQLDLKANKKIAEEQICAVCQNSFQIGEDLVKCTSCERYYHASCWLNANGCTNPPCGEENKFCWHCGKIIKRSAVKCRHCGAFLDEGVKGGAVPGSTIADRFTSDLARKEANEALTYAIISIFCCGIILGPIAISKGSKALKTIRETPGSTGEGKATTAIVIGIIATVLSVLGILIRLASI